MNTSIFLIIISPFTAFIPIIRLFSHLNTNKIPFALNPLNVTLFLLFMWSAISGFYNSDLLSIAASFAFLLYFGLCIWIENNCSDEISIKKILYLLWKFSFFPAVVGIIEKLISYFIDITSFSRLFWNPTYIPTKENYRILSTFGNPNVAGDWFAVMVIISIFFFEDCKNKRQKRIYFLSGILHLLCLVLTGSKGSIIGFVVSLIAYGIIKNCKKVWIMLISVVILGVVLIFLFPEVYASINPRNQVWLNSIQLFQEESIYGWGLLGIYPEIHEPHAHNMWIGILATLGIIGFLIYISMRWYIVDSIFTLIRLKIQAVHVLAIIQVLLVVHGVLDFTIITPQIGILFFGCCAMISRLATIHIEKTDTQSRTDHALAFKRIAMMHLYTATKKELSVSDNIPKFN